MSCSDLTLTVHAEDPITLEIVEAVIKPEQAKSVTPTYAQQTVLPDAGMTLGSVTVEPIPEPTDTLKISENGEYDVARIGTVEVDVPQGVFPEGTLDVIENGIFNIEQYESVSVNVPQVIGGNYFNCKKIRITYTGEDLTDIQYVNVVNSIKRDVPNYWLVFGFEVVAEPEEKNDFVAAFKGIDNYGDRVYYWLYNGTTIVSSYSNYPQNVRGNVKSGSVIDVLYVERKEDHT